MNKEGAIIIIEDNGDDQFIITEILGSLDYRNLEIMTNFIV